MKKNLTIALLICITVMFQVACSPQTTSTSTQDSGKGIYIEQGSDYEWGSMDEYELVLCVESNDVIITGDAECDTLIWVKDNVDLLTLDNLNQKDSKIHISLPTNHDCTLNFRNENQVFLIDGCDELCLEGEAISDELKITGLVTAFSNINMTSGTIRAGFIESWGNINIMNNTRVYIDSMEHENDTEHSDARIQAEESIVIDLDKDGLVDIVTIWDYPPVMATDGITLGENTELKTPEAGYIESSDPDFGDCFTIFDKNGTIAEDVLIRYKGI